MSRGIPPGIGVRATNLVWFRNDLRTRDQKSLHLATSTAGSRVIGIYCFDPRQFAMGSFGFKKCEKYRARFLIESVSELRENLTKLNIPLFVYYDRPESVIPTLVQSQNVNKIYLQKEWTQEEVDVLNLVKEKTEANNSVSFIENYDQFLFHPEDIPYANFQAIPEVCTPFRKKCEAKSSIRAEFPVPAPLPVDNMIETQTNIPCLEELGLEEYTVDSRSAFPFHGGEQKAWNRVQDYFFDTKQLSTYKHTRNGLVGTEYSSKFSAWLSHGCISSKSIYHEVQRYEKEIEKNEDTYWMIFELIVRDYFKYVSLKHGNKIFQLHGLRKAGKLPWRRDDDVKKAWIDGTTKYAFVNANMIELRETGWMSNRGRQNVCSFWAKEMEQDWRIGAAYFESVLVDYDVHSNWGNWIYNAGVGNDPRDRKFNIQLQTKRYDQDASFRRLWASKKKK